MAAHFPHLLDPRIHPDDARRSVRVPTWETFEHTTGFITLRDLAQSDWREDLERYTEQFKLGRVIWPLLNLLHCSHLAEVLDEIRRRGLYLFDLWSYVPGSPLEGAWSNITPPPGMVRHLQRTLGDRFLGIDNGEQDGRYVWATAEQQCPRAQSRFAQYLSFQRHFQKLCDELGNHMTALTSLTLGHYYLKEGNHVLLGAETAQALPNSQLYYAFIRGAGKQYGVHWFGNASVFNRWGWKDYGAEKRDGRYRSGPEEGSSLSLLKRLLYTHYLYNCVAIGFESGWLTEKPPYALTPIGDIQRGAVEFVSRHGQPGVMHTPAALLLDFFSGWVPPRHLYTPYVYQVWGGMPYEAGDYLTHGVLSLLLPGYEDASYFHDERGFLSPTPFGDMTDCLLSDAPLWVLRQYGLVGGGGRARHDPRAGRQAARVRGRRRPPGGDRRQRARTAARAGRGRSGSAGRGGRGGRMERRHGRGGGACVRVVPHRPARWRRGAGQVRRAGLRGEDGARQGTRHRAAVAVRAAHGGTARRADRQCRGTAAGVSGGAAAPRAQGAGPGIRRRAAVHGRRRPRLRYLPADRRRVPARALQQWAARDAVAHRLPLRDDRCGAGTGVGPLGAGRGRPVAQRACRRRGRWRGGDRAQRCPHHSRRRHPPVRAVGGGARRYPVAGVAASAAPAQPPAGPARGPPPCRRRSCAGPPSSSTSTG